MQLILPDFRHILIFNVKLNGRHCRFSLENTAFTKQFELFEETGWAPPAVGCPLLSLMINNCNKIMHGLT
jgi:hypothetical protein